MRKIVAVFLMSLAISCNNDGDELDDSVKPGTLRVTIDGIVMTSVVATATITKPADEMLKIKANFLSGSTATELTIVVYSNNSNIEIAAKEYNVEGYGSFAVREGLVGYLKNGFTYLSAGVHETKAGSVILTEVDRTNFKVSGTFEAKVGNDSETITFTEGSFSEIDLTL